MLFFHHLATLPECSLAKYIFIAQKKNSKLRGIVQETIETLEQWEISNVEAYTKWQWKSLLKKKLSLKNFEDLCQLAKGYKKINIDNYGSQLKRQEYMKKLSLSVARIIFRRNCGMIQTIRSNFKNDKRYKSEKYLCPDCRHLVPPVSHVDQQDLITSCEGNRDLREGLELSDLKQLAEYFRLVIERRVQRYGG